MGRFLTDYNDIGAPPRIAGLRRRVTTRVTTTLFVTRRAGAVVRRFLRPNPAWPASAATCCAAGCGIIRATLEITFVSRSGLITLFPTQRPADTKGSYHAPPCIGITIIFFDIRFDDICYAYAIKNSIDFKYLFPEELQVRVSGAVPPTPLDAPSPPRHASLSLAALVRQFVCATDCNFVPHPVCSNSPTVALMGAVVVAAHRAGYLPPQGFATGQLDPIPAGQ
jgi:hypothetical protein